MTQTEERHTHGILNLYMSRQIGQAVVTQNVGTGVRHKPAYTRMCTHIHAMHTEHWTEDVCVKRVSKIQILQPETDMINSHT